MDIQRIYPREWNCSAAVFGDLVFLSGTVADNKSLPMKGQTEEVLRKIDAVLAKAGTDKSRILSATVYMADAALKAGHRVAIFTRGRAFPNMEKV